MVYVFWDHMWAPLPSGILLDLPLQVSFPHLTLDGVGVLKFQVLCFYNRLNLDLIISRSVYIIFFITGLAYAALALTITLSCRPYAHFSHNLSPRIHTHTYARARAQEHDRADDEILQISL